MPRTAVSTPLIRDGQRAGAAPGPASTTAEPASAASAPEAAGPAWASHTMNSAELLDPGLPAAAGPRAPAQEQRDRVRVRLRRGLRAVATEPLMPQEPVGDLNHLKILVQHRPVPLPGRQPHRERSHSMPSLSKSIAVNDYQRRAQHPRRTTAPPARSPGSCDVMRQGPEPPEKEHVLHLGAVSVPVLHRGRVAPVWTHRGWSR